MRHSFLRSPSIRLQLSRTFVAFFAALAVMVTAMAPAEANPRYAAYVIDAKTGQVLFSRYADEKRYPASLTKMMTLYMLFEAMQTGRVGKSTRIPMSANAAAEPPTKIGLPAGESITVENAILSLITKSANDVSTAIAEFLGGSEQSFARLMTTKARYLGMDSTTFKNAHGLPDNRQVTTARDMAILGIALREHFPEYYDYFSVREFEFRGRTIRGHNRVLGRVRGADGIKTGYIRASGFNLVSSVQQDGRSIVAVVMGGRSSRTRDDHMVELIAEYLPRASKGSKQMLVARGPASSTIIAMRQTLPSEIAIPSYRPQPVAAAPVVQVASAAPAAVGVPQPKVNVGDRVEMAFAGATPSRVTPPAPVASGSVTAALEALKKQAEVDPISTASTPKAGWVIQVASLPSEAEAKAFLSSARSKAAKVLGEVEPFTQTFEHEGRTYYRARFSGFTGKQAAWATCGSLEAYNIACYAVEM